MIPLSEYSHHGVRYLFTDIDGTMTNRGRLPAESFQAIWKLHESGVAVVPVTGRSAGWCDHIARFWPVHGVVGENGGLYYRYSNRHMVRHYAIDLETRRRQRAHLRKIAKEVLQHIPGAKIAADQFTRKFDLAIDFAEDTGPLPMTEVHRIREIFLQHGAHAKISNIHVNGWFGEFDKVKTCHTYCQREFGFSLEERLDECAFIGDSPNDEPMFRAFRHSFGVGNVLDFVDDLKFRPRYFTKLLESKGFCEITQAILAKLN